MNRKPIPISVFVSINVILFVCFSWCAQAQEDPGAPTLVVDPTKDVEYSLNADDPEPIWTAITATNIVDSTEAMPNIHKWVHNLRAKPDVTWVAEFPDSTLAAPHTCQWTVQPTPLLADTMHQKFWIRWRCRAYVGTPDEQVADWSPPHYIRIIKLGPLTIAIKLN